MKYMGSKARIAKHILPIINKEKINFYVEPFVGGCNLIDKVNAEVRIGADVNKYLIACWNRLKIGWKPPIEISRELYTFARDCYNRGGSGFPDFLIGYIGFSGSYSGRFFDGGYAGVTKTKSGTIRNYPIEAYNNVMAQVDKIRNVEFIHSCYSDLKIPTGSVVYCDPPYKDTKEYTKTGFNSDEFFDWCRDVKGCTVYVSEYNAPDDFELLWEKEVSSSLRANGVIMGEKKSVERLFSLS